MGLVYIALVVSALSFVFSLYHLIKDRRSYKFVMCPSDDLPFPTRQSMEHQSGGKFDREDAYAKNCKLPLPVVDLTHEGLRDPHLFCYGCTHSIATDPFPGQPSGEHPCAFCVRNVDIRRTLQVPPPGYADGFEPRWYDGSPPRKLPSDNYIATDRASVGMEDGSVAVG